MLRRSSHLSSGPANALIITENNVKYGVFDPTITTGVSCSVYWECSNGYREVTTGINHALSYTTPDSSLRRWTIRCAAGLGAIRAIDCNTDSVAAIRNLSKIRSITSFKGYSNNYLLFCVCDLSSSLLELNLQINSLVYGNIDNLWPLATTLRFNSSALIVADIAKVSRFLTSFVVNNTGVYGSVGDLPITIQTCWLYSCADITPASIAHLTAIRDLRIYSMGWSSAVAGIDVVVDSVYSARMNYTYASGIVLRYGGTDAIPSGTEDTSPPADGVSDSDWLWNAGSGQHEPQTPQAKMFIMQNDPYGEGFKRWTFTKV